MLYSENFLSDVHNESLSSVSLAQYDDPFEAYLFHYYNNFFLFSRSRNAIYRLCTIPREIPCILCHIKLICETILAFHWVTKKHLCCTLGSFHIIFYGMQIAYYVGVQIDESCVNHDKHGLSPEMRQRSAVGAVKVAVRSLSMVAGTSES